MSRSERFAIGLLFVSALGTFALLVVLVLGMPSCRAGELAAPCDTDTLATVKAECHAQVRRECARPGGVVDESCPALVACTKRVRDWLACADGGVPVTAEAGAQ